MRSRYAPGMVWLVPSVVAITLAIQQAVASPVASKGTAVQVIRTVQDSEPTEIPASGTFTNVVGAVASVKVPDDSTALIRARFTGEGVCLSSGLCYVRLWTTGEDPAAVPTCGETRWYRLQDLQPLPGSIERTIGPIVGPATIQVRLQVGFESNATPGSKFVVDDWHLTLERIAAG